eukprot:CAMPEP_0202417858 /NCGR_PEP_ID=MMETSP1128-20130828/44314_1 /ASSEMBLY_ACC=CAM_ASM_000463 /TAXON_ID=3047 /ORGANISM="Dunaliella tertiolecta, Strain CCMP1320" /LENGTH=58 /DNA_ID=CAMNT_0049025289 /DNA_START=30 /DNA_END=206 /DNA_ORIENTATION=+
MTESCTSPSNTALSSLSGGACPGGSGDAKANQASRRCASSSCMALSKEATAWGSNSSA